MDRDYLFALSHFIKFGPVRLRRLGAIGWRRAWEANLKTLTATGLEETVAEEFITWRAGFNLPERLKNLSATGIKILTWDDDDYPPQLKNIAQPPPLLFYQGDLRPLKTLPLLAVVGSRYPSNYGRAAVSQLAQAAAQNNLGIISGLALGIDALAHAAALQAGGYTAGVLGSGLDQASLYPRANLLLAGQIVKAGGLLLSEFPPGAVANKFNFPRRNRLIAGLALGTLVVEAAAKSGSLITAHASLEQGNEVMAVPGSIFSEQSAGTNNLLKLGARVVTKIDDILETLNLEANRQAISQHQEPDLSEAEKPLWQALTNEGQHLDELSVLLKLDISVITSTLTLMEVKGLVKNIGNGMFIKNVF